MNRLLLILCVFLLSSYTSLSAKALRDGVLSPYLAPPFTAQENWLNSKPLRLSHLKGKVILIQFWNASSNECLHTFTHLQKWYAKYHKKGFEIISIHTPKFEFEKNPDYIKTTLSKYHMTWPVILDNHFATWQNFNNRYWPAHYLIDQNGYIVYQHFGEGNYVITEQNIRTLLEAPKMASKKSIPKLFLG